jgi:hypothetical protein
VDPAAAQVRNAFACGAAVAATDEALWAIASVAGNVCALTREAASRRGGFQASAGFRVAVQTKGPGLRT